MANKSTVKPGNKTPATKVLEIGELTTTPGSKAEYPVLPANEELSAAAKVLVTAREKIASYKKKADKAIEVLKASGVAFFFEMNADATVPSTGIEIRDDENRLALVLVRDKYPVLKPKKGMALADVAKIVSDVVGEKFYKANFKEILEVKLDIDEVKEAVQQDFVDDLVKLVTKYNAKKAVSVTQGVTVNDNFHVIRHTALGVDQNKALQELFPATVAIETA